MATKEKQSVQAVVEIQGHQYVVHPAMKLRVSRIAGEAGTPIELKNVYCVIDGDAVKLGKPAVPNAIVQAKIISQQRGAKVITFKYRPKARSRVKKGFRASETEIEITNIKA